ncbi:MAG: CopG family transcriptional regulator [Campylobacterota bacterium]|nr:CopG family transcriptional regulator [Campylobacterota bacterium]
MFDENTFEKLESKLGGTPVKAEKKSRFTLHLNLMERMILNKLAHESGLSNSAYIRFMLRQSEKEKYNRQ